MRGVHELSSGDVAYLEERGVAEDTAFSNLFIEIKLSGTLLSSLKATHHPTTLNLGLALTTISICCLSESVSSNSFPSTSPNGTPNDENTLTSPACVCAQCCKLNCWNEQWHPDQPIFRKRFLMQRDEPT
jgi:hypothetical protein